MNADQYEMVENEETIPINDPSNPPTTSNPRSSRTRKSRSGYFALALVFAITTTALVGFSTGAYLQLRTSGQETSKRLRDVSNSLMELRSAYESLSRDVAEGDNRHVKSDQNLESKVLEVMSKVETINTTASRALGNISDQISQLFNHSNVEVLETLEKTKREVSGKLDNTIGDVQAQIHSATQNITSLMNSSKQSLKKTEEHVQTQLNTTILEMKKVAIDASNEIEKVKGTVTSQLVAMNTGLDYTRRNLSIIVAEAQTQIEKKVKFVMDEVDKYEKAAGDKFRKVDDFVKFQIAGTFTLLGCLISLWHLTSHMRHYAKPDIQRRIMAVLWMVPIYSVTSWFSLVFPDSERFLSAVRDAYEAYVVYTFIALLIEILRDGKSEEQLIAKLTQHVAEEMNEYNLAVQNRSIHRPVKHLVPPCPCCYENSRVISIALAWLNQCRILAMQFVVLKPVLTGLPYVISFFGYEYNSSVNSPYHDQKVNWKSARLYVTLAMNISVALAFYGLLKFYHGTEKDLEWCDPWPKFLCIKGVVFMTFWQGIAIQVTSYLGWVDEKLADQIQNLLICIEMMIASIAHYYIFPYQEWQVGYQKKKKNVVLNDTLAVSDFILDFRRVISRWERGAINDSEAINDIENSLHRGRTEEDEDRNNQSDHRDNSRHSITSNRTREMRITPERSVWRSTGGDNSYDDELEDNGEFSRLIQYDSMTRNPVDRDEVSNSRHSQTHLDRRSLSPQHDSTSNPIDIMRRQNLSENASEDLLGLGSSRYYQLSGSNESKTPRNDEDRLSARLPANDEQGNVSNLFEISESQNNNFFLSQDLTDPTSTTSNAGSNNNEQNSDGSFLDTSLKTEFHEHESL